VAVTEVDGALGDGVGEWRVLKKKRDDVGVVARGGLGEVEDLRKGSAQGRDGALHIHRFGGGDYDEGGKWDAGSPDRRKWMDLVLERGRAKSCLYIPGRWAHLIGQMDHIRLSFS
jgi:hypothetical protein